MYNAANTRQGYSKLNLFIRDATEMLRLNRACSFFLGERKKTWRKILYEND